MRRPIVVLLAAVAALALGACGSSGSKSAGTTTTTPSQLLSSANWEKAKPTPSKSAQMVCQPEARAEIASSLGVKETRVTTPKWDRARHLYSCTYVYPHATLGLSVKEMSSQQETTAYVNGIKQRYGVTQQLIGLGQGAWILKNNDVVVRKNYKVLLVDVHGVPTGFVATMSRSDVATNVAVVIMGCWSGA